MLIDISKFGGIVPKILDPLLLPPNRAQVAKNCRFDLGGLTPLRENTFVLTPPNAGTPVSVYVYYNQGNRYFFVWPTDVDAVKAPLPNDSFNRIFFAEGGIFKVTDKTLFSYGGTAYPMDYLIPSPPAPSFAPSVSGTPSGTDPTLLESRAYVFTYVNSYGQEGPPSPVSNILEVYDGNSVQVSLQGSVGTKTKLLLHFDGVPGGDIVDSSLSAHGIATIQTSWMINPPDLENSVVKFGTGALQMQLAGWIYYPDSEDWYMGTSPFTIDFRARVDTIYTGQKHGFFQQRGDEDNYVDCWVEVFDNHYQLNFQIKAGGVLQVNASCFLASILHPPGYPATSSFLSNWVHIAIVRGWNGNPDSLALCVDGYGTVFTFTGSKIWPNLNDSFHIGGFWHIGDIYAQSFPGKIDEFRIVKGAAAWFGNFTPPSTPYDVSSATADPKYSLSLMRIYRLNQNASGAEYQFVAETALATEYYTDTVLDSALGEILATTEWDGPPSGIKGLIALPDGSLAGFVDNILCRSVPRYPHAWPASYQKATEKAIVGLGAFGTTIVVLTESQPYLAVGDDPSNVVMEKVDPGFSCSSKRGIVQAGEVTLYPSPEGLSAIGPNISEILTLDVITPDQWADKYNPSSISAYYWQAKYIGFYQRGNVKAGFIFDLKTRELTDLDFYATAGYYDKSDGTLYLAVEENIVAFNGDSDNYRDYDYRSKRFRFNPSVLGIIQVLAQSYPVYLDVVYPRIPATVNLPSSTPPYIAAFRVESRDPERLPNVGLADECELRIYGKVPVTAVYLASTMGELPT